MPLGLCDGFGHAMEPFSFAEDLTNPMDIPPGRPDAAQLRADGFRCYRCRTRIKAIRATDEFLRRP